MFLFHFSALAFLIPSPIIMILFCVGKASILPVVCGRLQKGKQRHGKENETIKQYVQTSLHLYYWQIALQ